MKKNNIEKYLQTYAESEVDEIAKLKGLYDYVVVIPICNEPVNCLKRIFSNIDKNEAVLVVLVINSPIEKNKSHSWRNNNGLFISSLREKSEFIYSLRENIEFLKFKDQFDTIIVDRNSLGLQIGKNQGVGLARKIGCDIALKYYQIGMIKWPWIFSTDADVILPSEYFTQIHQFSSEYSAIVLDFQHVSDDDLLNKLQFLYDFKIRYYHAGTTYAGSGYDYIPLGSTLIAQVECYAQVRGFPKKNAGEDFYLLNKLAKIKPIAYRNNNTTIKIESRFSDRVPFGTGPALMQINALENVDEYLYYHPKCFELLKQWIEFLKNMWDDNYILFNPPDTLELFELYKFFNCESVFKKSKKQITSKKRWTQFVHQWFDAFKTLKAIHFFDKLLGKQNLKQLLNSSDFDKVTNHSLQTFIDKYDKN